MAADRPYANANGSKILEVLTTATGFEHKTGLAEEVRRSRPPRVVWVPGPASYGGPNTSSREDMKVAAERARIFKVHFWGKDFEEAERLEDITIRELFNNFSHYAYELGTEEDPEGGDSEHAGILLVLPIKLLRIPIPAELRLRTMLLGATARGTVTTLAGGTSDGPEITTPPPAP